MQAERNSDCFIAPQESLGLPWACHSYLALAIRCSVQTEWIKDKTRPPTEPALLKYSELLLSLINVLKVFGLKVENMALTKVKLLGDAAHLFTVVSGHSWTTSLVFSSTLITDSFVIPKSRGTSLFLLFIFSCKNKFEPCKLYNTAKKHKI